MSLILSSVVTEKATKLTERNNVYTFYAVPNSNKISLKREIKALYGVDIVDIRTLVVSPKIKSKFTKAGLQISKSNKLKKVLVKVAEGQEINLFGN